MESVRAAISVCSLPPCGGGLGRGVVVVGRAASTNPDPHPQPLPTSRAIACGNFGFESCVRERGWIPKLRARPDFDSDVAPVRRKLATCDCPALRGRVGEGGSSCGVVGAAVALPRLRTPAHEGAVTVR